GGPKRGMQESRHIRPSLRGRHFHISQRMTDQTTVNIRPTFRVSPRLQRRDESIRTFSNLRSEEENCDRANCLHLLDQQRKASIFIFVIVLLRNVPVCFSPGRRPTNQFVRKRSFGLAPARTSNESRFLHVALSSSRPTARTVSR